MHYFINNCINIFFLSTFINELMHRTFARKVKIKKGIFYQDSHYSDVN